MIELDEIKRVLIVGTGTMGQQIGLQCAMHGYQVMMYDVQADVLPAAQASVRRELADVAAAGVLPAEQVDAVLGRMQWTAVAADAARDADLLSESVPEDPALKGKVLAQFHALCPPHTIFTTNSSTLLPSMFAAATQRPSQFAAFHFHLPAWVSNVVDIMPHPGTDTAVITLLEGFARRIGQIPIVLQKESSGYVFNSLLSALNTAALSLVVKNVAAPEDVDRAWMGVMKTAIGPFGIQDMIGLDTIWKIIDFWATTLNDATLRAHADFLKPYLDAGKLGRKTGEGFYTYPHPAFAQSDFLTGPTAVSQPPA
ncbi:MAG: 3-hydroxyacyl-CoA dehydrogenase [Ardenticatenaceae bacterium]|nr:3-hydroxyacyl-CoA dehydrogenase [Ardenticatenaceae bacterium]